MFAASCIGIAGIAIILEGMRRISRDYDNFALKQLSAANANRKVPQSTPMKATALQQLIRAILHTITFGLAYILMLLAMYYNGYIIISILLGTGIGKFFCDWLTIGQTAAESVDDCPTACCG
jgi:copper transporter 1